MCVGQIELLGETCVFSGDDSYDSVSDDLQSMLNGLKISESASSGQNSNQSCSSLAGEEHSDKDPETVQKSHRKTYEDAVRRELDSKPGSSIDLSTALQLEVERVQLGLTVKDREQVEVDLKQPSKGMLDPLRQISSGFSLDLRRMQVGCSQQEHTCARTHVYRWWWWCMFSLFCSSRAPRGAPRLKGRGMVHQYSPLRGHLLYKGLRHSLVAKAL